MLDLKALILRKGSQAKTVLDDEIFQEAVSAVRVRYVETCFNTKLGQTDARENCYRAVRLLDEVVGQLQTYVSDASYEEKKNPNQG